jgi:hypothetical protein
MLALPVAVHAIHQHVYDSILLDDGEQAAQAHRALLGHAGFQPGPERLAEELQHVGIPVMGPAGVLTQLNLTRAVLLASSEVFEMLGIRTLACIEGLDGHDA